MSNRRKPKQLNRSSGALQRPKGFWFGRIGNPTTAKQVAEQEAEARKPKFQFSSKQGEE